MKPAVFIILLFLAYGVVVFSQPYSFRHYKVEEGLSYNAVICSYQDKKGFLWFGTKDGLNRFDGNNFKIFRHDPDDSTTIGNNFIKALHEGKNGILWIGTGKGLYSFDPSTETFKLFNKTLSNEVKDIQTDDYSNLWYIFGKELYKFNFKTRETTKYNEDVTSICKTIDGHIWTASATGKLRKYNLADDLFESFDLFNKSKPVANKWIEDIYDTGKESILVGTANQGAKLFDIKLETYTDVPLHNPDGTEIYVRNFTHYTNDEYWIASESGIFTYNLKTNKATNLRKQKDNPYSISDNAVYTFTKDQEGGIWAGTYFGGINYCPNQSITFEKFFPRNDSRSISGNIVREICQDQYGNFWVGTEDAALNKFNPRTGSFIHFYPSVNATSISHSNIHALLTDGNYLWVGTYEHGLNKLDIPSGKVIKRYAADTGTNSLKSNFVVTAYKTRKGEILIGTWAGLFRYNPTGDDFTQIKYVPSTARVYSITEDHTGKIWICTKGNGVYWYDAGSNTKGNYTYDPHNDKSLSGMIVNNVYEDSYFNLWFATEDGGLSKFNTKTGNFKRYNTKTGFPANFIFKILEDNNKNLWVSTSRGLICMNLVTEKIKIFTKANGLLSDQFNYNSGYKDQAGKLYFGSVNGLVAFNPQQIRDNKFIPPVYITSFQVANKELPVNKPGSPLKKSILFTSKIVLPYNKSSFSLDFSALSFTAPEMTEYSYKMKGLDKDWTYLKTNRKVYFTQLGPGNYTFLVKVSTNNSGWNFTPTQLYIEILPPFYASLWAYLFYTLVILLLIYQLIHYYHKKTETKNRRRIEILENEKEKEIYQAKIEFFTNITHEIRTPLTLIKGPVEIVKKSDDVNEIKSHIKTIEKNTDRLLKLTNQLLDFRKTESKIYSLNFVRINVSELLEETHLRFKNAAEQKNIAFNLVIPAKQFYVYADPEALTKILSNLFSNAIKYAEKYIEVNLLPYLPNATGFCIEVKNDGYLIPDAMKDNIFKPFYRLNETANEPGTGIGLPLARSLAELHNGTLELDNPPKARINTFRLTLPVHQAEEFDLQADDPTSETAITPHHLKSSAKGQPVILVVEDNSEIQSFIANELSSNYTVFTAFNGKDAVKILSKNNIQLIVSDIMMPEMDGLELCRTLKSDINYSHIPLILLTAKNTYHSKIQGLETGADAYIEKPFSPEHLKIQISNLLDNRKKVKDHFANSPLAHIKTMAYSKEDEKFLEKLMDVITRELPNTKFDIDQLASAMFMSRTTLFRKVKAISNLTPNEMIHIARLKRAAELLEEGKYRINEIADMVGFSSQSNFTRLFQKQFHMTPSEYVLNKVKILNK